MKKAISMKPLALATAFAAGSTVSMIATALPGGDTLGAAGVVNESICQQSVDMTISGGSRSVTTGTGTCQLRTLPPTKGFVRTESSPAGGTVSDSAAMVAGGGEFYEAYVGGNRDAAVLLTPNRALATSRSVTFATGADGSMAFDLAATVQPSTGLQSSWLTGTYTIVNRQHNFSMVASGLEKSTYANPNLAMGERNYTKALNVTFNGNGTCTINDIDSHVSASLTQDPLMNIDGTNQMDVDCTIGGGQCGQNDGRNYVAMGVINVGSTATLKSAEEDWQDSDADNKGLIADSCTYSTAAGKVTVNYATKYGNMDDIPGMDSNSWSVTYDVSSDLRYLVSDGNSLTDTVSFGADGLQKGGLAVGVRTNGSPSLTGKTYLFNSLDATLAASTPATASYENPSSPVYQEEECISRGSLSLAAAGACTVDVVSTCTGRSKSGYEETADGAADGTITDSLTVFDGTPLTAPTCSWSGTASNLTVSLGIQDPDGNPVTKVYTGSASDNGEALVLQGVYNVGGPTPDVDNPPLLPQQKFNMLSMLVAQEYQGTLSADADADGLTNLEDFQWGNDQTPPAGASGNDFNGDGISDIMMRQVSTGEAYVFPFADYEAPTYAFSGLFPSTQWSIKATADFDANGTTDVLMRKDNGEWQLFRQGGANGTTQSYAPIALYAGDYEVAAVGDLDGSGNNGIIMVNPNTKEYFRFLVVNGSVTDTAALYLWGGDWSIADTADLNADGITDVLMHNAVSGEWAQFNLNASGNVASSAVIPLWGGTWEYVATADFDGDADNDIMLRNSADGGYQVFEMQGGSIVANNDPGLFPSTAWTFSFASDTNADGITDVVVKNTTNGLWFVGLMNSSAVATNVNFYLWDASSWNLASVGDFNGDGTEDAMLYNPVKFEYYTFPITNGTVGTFKYSRLFLADSTAWPLVD